MVFVWNKMVTTVCYVFILLRNVFVEIIVTLRQEAMGKKEG